MEAENTINRQTPIFVNQDAFPNSLDSNVKTNKVVYFLSSTDELGLAYSDLTGNFPVELCGAKIIF